MSVLRDNQVDWNRETDVLVIGAGGCGLAAAGAARSTGADVMLLEKEAEIGGNTILSEGIVLGADTQVQRDAGIEDSAEQFARDVKSVGEYEDEFLDLIAEESGPTLDWLTEEVGVTFVLETDSPPLYRNSVHRSHYSAWSNGEIARTGEPLVDPLGEYLDENGVQILTDTPVEYLVVDDDGAVTGAVTKMENDTRGRTEALRIRAGSVLLATSGFAANPDMIEEEFPDIAQFEQWGANGNTGDELRWGEELGVEISTLGYQGYPLYSQPEWFNVPLQVVTKGAFIVNTAGKRFGDAGAVSPPDLFDSVVEQPEATAYVIFDQDILDALLASTGQERIAAAVEDGVFDHAESIEALADHYGIDADSLSSTLEEVNGLVEGRVEAPYGRKVQTTLSPPFYGTKVRPCIVQTLGGLEVNDRMQVMDRGGDPVPNLYAGGGASVNPMGISNDGYLPGTQIMIGLTMGRMMGLTAAERVLPA